jgi:hypothetical protein
MREKREKDRKKEICKEGNKERAKQKKETRNK